MHYRFSKRSGQVSESFIAEMLKYIGDPEMISFSGGFPSPRSFPTEALEKAASAVLREEGEQALQYGPTQGYLPLRQWIAQRYKTRLGLDVDPEHILITTGSQQGLDLMAKIFLDPGDPVVLEFPSYLGAIQSFSLYEPQFHEIRLNEDGLDLEALETCFATHRPKLLYIVPNFQNPTGISYSRENRLALAELAKRYEVLILEDDPYGELRYEGESQRPLKALLPDQTILLGSFSKIISPGMRLGWMVANKDIIDYLSGVKEASDLQASSLDQMIIHRYLTDNDLDTQLDKTRAFYGHQRKVMLQAMKTYFPKEVHTVNSEGGMFFWVTLPNGLSALDLFYKAVEQKVIFVPGDPFYVTARNMNTLRLNYTSADPDRIVEGIRRLALVIREMLAQQ